MHIKVDSYNTCVSDFPAHCALRVAWWGVLLRGAVAEKMTCWRRALAHLGCRLTARSESLRASWARVKGSRPYSACASDWAAGMLRSFRHKLQHKPKGLRAPSHRHMQNCSRVSAHSGAQEIVASYTCMLGGLCTWQKRHCGCSAREPLHWSPSRASALS